MYLHTLPKHSFATGINVPYQLPRFIELNQKISCCHAPDPAELMSIPCRAHEYPNPKFVNTAQKRRDAKPNYGKVNSTYYVLYWHHQACLQIR
jgi:hypothetical protein